MRFGARLSTVVVAATGAFLIGACGPTWYPSATEPVTPQVSLGTSAGPRATELVAQDVLDGGLALPDGIIALRAPSRSEEVGDLHRWEVDLDLGPVDPATALAAVRSDLADGGFDVRGGTDDVFGARQREGRWEIVVARVSTHGTGAEASDILTIGIGSRPA